MNRILASRISVRFGMALAACGAAFVLALTVTGATAQDKAGEASGDLAKAIFAGGCFWCVEADFDKVPGVQETISGYIGGNVDNPSYRQVVSGGTGHKEAVEITYDPAVVSYEELLEAFWHSVDPVDAGGQFCDRGESYTTGIFAVNEEQLEQAKASKGAISEKLGQEVATTIEMADTFWPAEDYHQNYYRSEERILSRFGYVTKAYAYKGYREGCRRDARLKELWGEDYMRGIPQS
ncbi:peptide-methionine (S)-S-oxide reductase MsrA [Afifella pfennigii]|uniref:peptide-methionine (S)-S-oxide reductase MsrA n=1 Tax=Afifella pfennigii TaxID=209897 RepID=UPI001AEC4E4E|nr:peptide-methionine (S)-S-oxide reductase MsrA [Afifella pfennigii]